MTSSISIKPPENVYRPPYEWTSALVFFVGAVILLFVPLPIFSVLPVMVILIGLAIHRFLQGRRIHKFRKSLKTLLFYSATPDGAIIKERQLEGIELAKQRNAFKGRPKQVSDEQISEIKQLMQTGESKEKIAKRFGISRATLYRYAK